MFNELREEWITKSYNLQKGILIPSIEKQLSTVGWILDLNSLPTKPFQFKELFIRWLISINRQRIEKGLEIIVTYQIIRMCPLWNIVKCPIKRITLTKESLFNKPSIGSNGTTGTIGTVGTIGSINK